MQEDLSAIMTTTNMPDSCTFPAEGCNIPLPLEHLMDSELVPSIFAVLQPFPDTGNIS